MAKQKKTRKFTREELKQFQAQMRKMSNISADELLEQIKSTPDGMVAAQACCTMLFDQFMNQYLPAPSRGDRSDEDYAAELASYENIRQNIRQIAQYWYIAGTHHSRHIQRVTEMLEDNAEGQSNK